MSIFRVHEIEVTASTNEDVKKAAESGEPEGFVICALRQTGGKGRMGRVWESPEGNLYVSVLLRPECAMKDAARYGFVAALAVHDAVSFFAPDSDVKIKWPNDVLADGKKISGILLETDGDADCVGWLVIGVGINVLHRPENVIYPAVSLRELTGDAAPPVEQALNKFLQCLEARLEEYAEKGFSDVREEWLKRAKTGKISVKLPDGTLSGEFAGLDGDGNLVLRLDSGAEKVIASGDVFLC